MLEQSKENHVQRLRPARALSRMMSQLVFDVWSSYERELAILHLMELLGKFPVYLLSCTPAEGAVWCLEQQLKKDGVLK